MSELVIIGNGFDLHHGLQTSYSAFANFAKQNSPSIYTLLSELFLASYEQMGFVEQPNASNKNDFIHARWCDFETCLGLIDDEIFEQRSREDISEYMEELNMDEALVEEFIENISSILNVFRNWVKQINLPTSQQRTFQFDPSSIFINFNYTETLEKFYAINPNRIFYIHGSRENKDDLIVGHDSKPPQPQSKHDLPDFHHSPFYAYLRCTHKPVETIEPKLTNWLKQHPCIKQISVRGHSLGRVDLPYFKALNTIYPKAKWSFSYFSEDSLRDIRAVLYYLNICEDRVTAVATLPEFECRPDTRTNVLPSQTRKLKGI